jgi:hypothetical protein
MDQEAKQQNMNSNLEHNQDAEQKLYEMPNMGIILEPRIFLNRRMTHMTLRVFS